MSATDSTEIRGDSARQSSVGKWLHRYAILVAASTWCLIFAGGMVTSTGSGLSVPDWPTTYGQNMFTYPPSKWVGGIFYEHGHRLIASSVGMLTIGLCIWLWLREQRRWLAKLGVVALLTVIAQGVLGGLTVKYLLPTPISVGHACLAQAFLCLTVSIAVFTSPSWKQKRPVNSDFAASGVVQTPTMALMLVLLIFGQLMLGAIMRHTDSGLAVLDFPKAYGQWLPTMSDEAIGRYNDYRRYELTIPAVTARQIAWHMAHRVGAITVALAAAIACGCVIRRHAALPALRRPAILILLLVVVQFVLGAWTVLSGKLAIAATLHVAVGAATLATAWFMTLQAYRHVGLVRRESMPVAAALGAAS